MAEQASPSRNRKKLSPGPTKASPPLLSPPNGGGAFDLWVILERNTSEVSRFGAAVFVGIVVLVVSPRFLHHPLTLIAAPLAVMTLYGAIAVPLARRAETLSEFGDSFYYLGFALTLVAVLLASGVLDSSLRLNDTIIIEFSRAVTTTVAGVIVRSGAQIYDRMQKPGTAELEHELHRLTREYIDSLRTASRETEKLIRETVPALHASLASDVGRTELVVKQLAGSVAGLETQISAISSSTSALIATMRSLNEGVASSGFPEKLETLASGVEEKGGRFVTQLSKIAEGDIHERFEIIEKALKSTSTELAAFQVGLRETGGVALAELSSAVTSVHGHVDRVRGQLSHLNLEQVVEALNQMAGEIATSPFPASLDGVVGKVQERLDRLTERIELTSSSEFEERIRTVGETLEETARQARTLRDELGAAGDIDLTALPVAVRHLTEHVAAIDHVLEEVSEAVLRRLESIR